MIALEKFLPPIPEKRYFTISEVSNLCGVKPHVLRYWEQEFTQLRPMKRRGNRRYYQHHEVQLIRKIRYLLHEQGFTIVGARSKLQDFFPAESDSSHEHEFISHSMDEGNDMNLSPMHATELEISSSESDDCVVMTEFRQRLNLMRLELLEIRNLLS